MTDKIINWYNKIDNKQTKPRNKNFYKHHIEPCSMVTLIGGTGSGKTNALIDFLHRNDETFHKIIIFSASSLDEPLYKKLIQNMPQIEAYNNIDELPSLNDFDDEDNENEKLIVFDDFINLTPKQMKKIQEYATAGRKKGFTCFFLAQNYIQIPKNISRNSHYFIIFKINDNVSIRNIIRNHNLDDVPFEVIKNAYDYSTKDKGNFFMIDLKGDEKKRYRHNFLNFLRLK